MKALKVTVLDTMLAGDLGRGIGEWGFAAVVEVDGQRLLFDTGQRPETVLHNARELGIDLSGITDVVITHNHGDHTAGLVTLRREMAKKNPKALSRAHVARGIFDRRPGPNGAEGNGLLPVQGRVRSARRHVRRACRTDAAAAVGLVHRPGAADVSGAQLERHRPGADERPGWSRTPFPKTRR